MKVTTRNYRLEKKDYIRMALRGVLIQQWWAALIALGICCCYLWIPSFWWIFSGVLAYGLFVLFWYIQFYGVTHLDQGKMLFERFSYEITSQQILMKLNAREGMPLKWEQILRARIGKDYYLLFVNKAQLIHWPFKIFASDNERKFVLSILRNRGLVK
jgi:hypothetical protein